MLTYLALRCLGLAARWLPRAAGYRLAALLGDLTFVLNISGRRAVYANLRRVLGEQTTEGLLRTTSRAVFRTGALNYYDLFRLPRLSIEQFNALFAVRGWEHFERSLNAGKGAIAVTAHLGNLDVVAHVTLTRKVHCTIPTEQVKPRRLLELVTRLRASQGLTIVPVDGTPTAARAVYQALRRNELVGIVGDRDVLGNGLRIPFFGEIASIPSGAVALALKTGAPIHGARALRMADGSYELLITPPIELPRMGDPRLDLQLGTELVAAMLEGFIREVPEQWVVFEPIWDDGRENESRELVGAVGEKQSTTFRVK